MLAEVAARLGRYGDAETLLERCLELAPSFVPARHNYAFVLHREGKPAEALKQIDLLLSTEPRNAAYRKLKAAILGRIGEYDQAIELYAGVLAEYPKQAKAWMSYGHALKTAGRRDEAIDAYRKSIELAPQLGEAYWSLANLKTFRLQPTATCDAMRAQLARPILRTKTAAFRFRAGQSARGRGEYAESFEHYARGNSLREAGIAYDADETTAARAQRAEVAIHARHFSPSAPARAARRPIRFSSSACPGPARR